MTDERLRGLERHWRMSGDGLGNLLAECGRAGETLPHTIARTDGQALRYLGALYVRAGFYGEEAAPYRGYLLDMDAHCRTYIQKAQEELLELIGRCSEKWVTMLNHKHDPAFQTLALTEETDEVRSAFATRPHYSANWRAQARSAQAHLNRGEIDTAEQMIRKLDERKHRATAYILLMQTMRGDPLEGTVL